MLGKAHRGRRSLLSRLAVFLLLEMLRRNWRYGMLVGGIDMLEERR
jgi:hypothetical protein